MSGISDEDKTILRQRYIWWALAAYEMKPLLTKGEWRQICRVGDKIAIRMGSKPNSWPVEEGDKWPASLDECWDALK